MSAGSASRVMAAARTRAKRLIPVDRRGLRRPIGTGSKYRGGCADTRMYSRFVGLAKTIPARYNEKLNNILRARSPSYKLIIIIFILLLSVMIISYPKIY